MIPTLGTFADEMFDALGVVTGVENRRAFARVALAEGCFDPSAAGRWNPWNSSIPFAGSRPINGDGVQAYRSFSDGVAGTVNLLTGQRWRGVVAAFKWAPTSGLILGEVARVYADWGSGLARVDWHLADPALNRALPT